MDKINYETFKESIIAQDDDCNWDESGWVAVYYNKKAYLARYGHCSCYGTWTALGGNEGGNGFMPENWYVWSGTLKELIRLAKEKLDRIG